MSRLLASAISASRNRLGKARIISISELSDSASDKPVLGCGSNVVDHIYNVKVVPKAGQKGFFLSPFKAIEKRLIGGVTLNHLSWAALGGVRTGLLALQGEDELGHFIRTNLKKLGVETSFIKANSKFSTSQCHVFIQEDGERSIVMAPASTSLINAQAMEEYFGADIENHASMVTTEISQVPLSGVLALLKAAKKANVVSVLDLDVPPNVAVEEAGLGTLEEVVECVKLADVLKPTQKAAEEILALMAGKEASGSLSEVTWELLQLCGCKLLAMTNGSEGSILANKQNLVEVEAPTVSKVMDTTGAGDAFLGGLITQLKSNGIPHTTEQLRTVGQIANAYGAACTQTVGGVPVQSSYSTILSYLPDTLAVHASKGSVNGDQGAGTLSVFDESVSRDVAAIQSLSGALDWTAVREFVDIIEQCEGQILLSGIGKSGQVAHRFSSSLSSLGIPSQFVHATEWSHGDLGKAKAGKDVVLMVSHSGNTLECVVAAKQLLARGVTTLALTGNEDSLLKQLCVSSLVYPHNLQEPFGCLPTTSLVIQDVLLNGLICELIQRRGISKETFKLYHPGGAIGSSLS